MILLTCWSWYWINRCRLNKHLRLWK